MDDTLTVSGLDSPRVAHFHAIRGLAISTYNNMDNALSNTFQLLAGMKSDAAIITFHKIQSSDSRLKIIEKLVRRRFRDEYNAYFVGLLKFVRWIDGRRNCIAHWPMLHLSSIKKGHKPIDELVLSVPTWWIDKEDAERLTTNDMIKFMHDCDFVAQVCELFCLSHRAPYNMPRRERLALQEIFRGPFHDRPPEGSPLARRL